MLMMKLYTNLIYTVFSETFLIFKILKEVIIAIQEYSREAQKWMIMGTRGSIIRIVLLKSLEIPLEK